MSRLFYCVSATFSLLAFSGCAVSQRYSPLARLERSVIFQPSDDSVGNWNPEIGHENVDFHSADGTRLNGWFLDHPNPRGVALFLHGNAGNITSRAPSLAILNRRHGLAVMTFDYRGYGRSEGVPDEQGILADARAARKWLAERKDIPEREIIIMGRSLGGAVAVDLAQDGAKALVLASTFTSLPDVAASHFRWLPTKLLMAHRLNSLQKIKNYRGPLLHSHGTHDNVIPFEQGERLFAAAASENKQFVPIEGAGHNDPLPESYRVAFDQFLQSSVIDRVSR